MKICYLETQTPRKSGIDNAELAMILEKKYHLLEEFSDFAMNEILEYMLDFGIDLENLSLAEFNTIESFIQDRWRDYIELGQHGKKSKYAESEGRTAFIDTQKYYLGIVPKIILD